MERRLSFPLFFHSPVSFFCPLGSLCLLSFFPIFNLTIFELLDTRKNPLEGAMKTETR